MSNYLAYILITGNIGLAAVWLFITIRNSRRLTGYLADVERYLDDMNKSDQFDILVMYDFYKRGQSAWDAAQAMENTNGKV